MDFFLSSLAQPEWLPHQLHKLIISSQITWKILVIPFRGYSSLMYQIIFQFSMFSRGMQMSDVDTHICRRLYSLRNKEQFCQAISTTNWDEINRATDTKQAFDLFHNRLTELYNGHFPKVRIKKKYNNRRPWLSELLKNSIRQNNKLYVKSKKIRSVLNEELYKTYKRKLQKLMKVAEKHYYHDLLVKYSNDMKKSWGVIKQIINRN